ncbi:sensor histidine kinase [Pseudoalteromonas phenolica]|uniref:sensor histidine kinase n=1 Tax=Pseudoalteromonas phenolica TaxID=161398 RepID=UPI00110B8163|nr:HAMP domain-containing sensor histidine kinase [Pseudoalteromonas phenolica]TMO53896.1 two-component sensor histidine kinase [Pseudoalteromonas phenolica]
MIQSLYQRLSLTISTVLFIILISFVTWTQCVSEVSRSQAEQKLHLGLAEHLANDNPLLKQGVYDYKALESLFHTLMVLGPSFEFYFVDPSGKLVTYSAKPGDIKKQSVDLRPLLQLIEEPHNLPIFGDDPRSFDQQKIFSVAPVYNNDTLQGYLYVIIGSSAYDSIFTQISSSDHLFQHSAGLLILVIILMFVAVLLFRYITSPLKQLGDFIHKAEDAKFDLTELTMPQWSNSDNEVHQLGNSVNQMLVTINQQMAQLTELDSQRRQLLAHLSHDLRTPLASLQGYLELIEKQHAKPEQQMHYLQVALKNCTQLKSLIDQIFELAHLESGHANVQFEVFNLGELIYDILAKFALKTEQANITLTVQPKTFDAQVYSDIAKLERVLTNLIDNAIRHTPSGGNITIEVSEHNKQYALAVRDTGLGINAKELPYIFEARYKASNSQGCKKTHAGLGLAITSRLIRLLKSEIKVDSELGKGTEFTFAVRKATDALN